MKTRFLFGLVFFALCAWGLGGAARVSGAAEGLGNFSSQANGLGTERQVSALLNPGMDCYRPAAVYNPNTQQTFTVWHRHLNNIYYIEGRRIDANGQLLGGAPLIIASGQTPVYQPAVTYNTADHYYLVVWMRNTNLDGKTYAIWGKLLNDDLSEARSEFQIHAPEGSNAFWMPRVAYNPKGVEYMVVYNTFDTSSFPSMWPVSLIESTLYWNGDLVGHITVIYNTPGNLIYPQQPDVIYANGGGTANHGQYLMVWRQFKPGTSESDIWAANIDASLGGYLPSLPPFPIDTSTVDQSAPRIASNGNNDFLVVWQERSGRDPNDWDIRGREINQIGTIFGGVHVIAGQGSTDEQQPSVAAWPGTTPRYVVGYQRQSASGQDLYLALDNNGANLLAVSDYIFWMDYFPAVSYAFYLNANPAVVTSGARVQLVYEGVSNTPGDYQQIFSRAWSPYVQFLPAAMR